MPCRGYGFRPRANARPGMTSAGNDSMRAWLMAMMVALAGSSPRQWIASPGSRWRSLINLHECSKGLGIVRLPARQGRAVLDDVARRPEDPPLVETSRHIVIGAQNVKVAGVQPLDHEVDGLLRRPGPGRLLDAALGGKPGEHKTRNHQVSAALARPGLCLIVVFGGFCVKALTPALDTLYAGSPGGVVMPCFEPVLMM